MPADQSDPEFLIIGRVARPHGVRGELRVDLMTDDPARFGRHAELYLSRREIDQPVPYALESVRFHQKFVLVKLAGIDDREAADRLRTHLIRIPFRETEPLADGEFYLFQLLGMVVVTDEGEPLGQVSEIIQTGANDVFVVDGGPAGEILLPDTEEVVLAIDREQRQIIVHLIEGLRP